MIRMIGVWLFEMWSGTGTWVTSTGFIDVALFKLLSFKFKIINFMTERNFMKILTFDP